MTDKLEAQVDVNGPTLCVYHMYEKKLGPKLFNKLFPDIGPCDVWDRNSPEYQELEIENLGDRQFQELQKVSKPTATEKVTTTGQDVIDTCVNHAKRPLQNGIENERMASYARPLNKNESPDIERRMFERSQRAKNKARNTMDRFINRLQQMRIDKAMGVDGNEVSRQTTHLKPALPDIDATTPVSRPVPKQLITQPTESTMPTVVTPTEAPAEGLPSAPTESIIPKKTVRRPWEIIGNPEGKPTGNGLEENNGI